MNDTGCTFGPCAARNCTVSPLKKFRVMVLTVSKTFERNNCLVKICIFLSEIPTTKTSSENTNKNKKFTIKVLIRILFFEGYLGISRRKLAQSSFKIM